MPTSYTRRAYIVVVDALKAQANAQALLIDPTTQGDTFSVQLSASGLAPATHWACGWTMTQAEWNQADARLGHIQGAWLLDAALFASFDAAIATIGLLRVRRATF